MTGTATIALHEPWILDELTDAVAPQPTGGFLARHRGDLVLIASTLLTAVGAGLTARVLCGV